MSVYHLIRDTPRLEIINGVHILEYKLEVLKKDGTLKPSNEIKEI